jgi:hypothetical protein
MKRQRITSITINSILMKFYLILLTLLRIIADCKLILESITKQVAKKKR